MKPSFFLRNIIVACIAATVLMAFLWHLGELQRAKSWTLQGTRGNSAVTKAGQSNSSVATNDHKWVEAYGNLPLSFEENLGQTAREVRFVSHGRGYELFLTPQEAVLSLRRTVPLDLSPLHRTAYLRAIREARQSGATSTITMRLDGANPTPQVMGSERLPGKSNYFIGSDRRNWRTGVRSYARVKYASVYPGVDLIFYGNQRRLEYDFIVSPGVDPKTVRLKLEGARKLRVNSNGNLLLTVADGEVELQKPLIYQEVKGQRRKIAGGYIISRDRQVTFAVARYDRSEPLVIDPVLNYSTYLGGSANDTGSAIAVDSLGNAFVVGTTMSTDFPTTTSAFNKGPLASNPTGAVFVTELNATGTQQLYSTYLAGSSGDFGFGIALDPTGNIYVTGETFSVNFPTTSNALKPGPLAANVSGTSFISKINPTLSGTSSLVYSSYLGGTSGDFGNGIAADANQNAYITGLTLSPAGSGQAAFPTTANAFQSSLSSSTGNAFLTRIDTTQSGTASLIYSTYLGGNGANSVAAGFGDEGLGIAVDSANNAYITGATSSTNFPTTLNAFQTTAPLAVAKGTVFVSRIDTTKTGSVSLIYSTYLGGNTFDFGTALALGPNNVAYVTGTTDSLSFPTTSGAFQVTGSSSGVAFISLLDTGLTGSTSLKYSTFLGGSGGDTPFGIRVDALGNAYVAGGTSSANFPVTKGAFQSALASGAPGDGFVSKLNPSGNGAADLIYSTYFGGSGASSLPDEANAIAIDSLNNAYITGVTRSSTTFPISPNPGAFQTTLKGPSDAFVAKLSLLPTIAISPSSLDFGTQAIGVTTSAQTVTLTNNTTTPLAISSIVIIAINPASPNADFAKVSDTCGTTVAAGSSCVVGVTFKPSLASAESASLVFTYGEASSPQTISLIGTGSNAVPTVILSKNSLTFAGQLVTTSSTVQTVTVTNSGSAALAITSITVSGDFAQTDDCGASVAGGSLCTISVTFKPTATAGRTGTLTITDNASGSPQTVALSGTGWDFGVTAQSSLTVTGGISGTTTVTVTPLGGFNQSVSLSCSSSPVQATCAISPASVTPADGVTPVTATLMVRTSAIFPPRGPDPISPTPLYLVVFSLVLLAFLLINVSPAQRVWTRLGLIGAVLIFIVLGGCSEVNRGSLKGTSTLTVTATSGSVNHMAKITLKIVN